MTLVKNDIELGRQTEEAEERNHPEAKLVEAPNFQFGEWDSSSHRMTEMRKDSDWRVETCGNDFSIKTIDRQVAGINTSRLSVLKT